MMQNQVNRDALITAAGLNQMTQTGPFGTVRYEGELGSPERRQITELSPEIQRILTGQLQGSQSLTDLANQRLAGAPRTNFELGTNPVDYMGASGVPELNTSFDGGPALTTSLGAQPNYQMSMGAQPGFQTSIGAQPGLQSSFNTGPGAMETFNWGSVPILTEFGDAGPLARGVANAGQIQRGLGDAGQLQRSVSLAGQPELSTDFGRLVQQAQDAAYATQTNYLDPRFDRERNNLESRLAAQGVVQGSDAWRNEMADFESNKNLAYQQAVNEAVGQGADIQGQLFGQNLAARQQGVGEQFDMAGFANDAQRQAFEQMLASGQFANSAQAQQYGQNLSDAQFQNQAQQQMYDQLLGRAQFSNAGQAQAQGQNMDYARFTNDARAQNFSQNMQAAGFANQTAEQQLQRDLAMAQFGNSALGQQFDRDLAAAQFGNSAIDQSFARDLASAQFGNAAAGQQFGQNLDMANFGNSALAQQMAMALQQRNFDQNLYQQGLNNQILGRNQNINEAMAYFSGTPISGQTMPNYQGIPTSTAAQGSPDAMSLASSNYQAQQQARAAGLGGAFGALGQIGGSLMRNPAFASALGFCWVAREVYGAENPDWLAFREWLKNVAPRWLFRLYRKYGERLAAWIKDKPAIKGIIRDWMDARVNACP